jgi:hypothetical protein
MNKLDQQFEQLMKGITIDSPSKGFSLKVMERIQAEAAIQKHSILEDYQPVISKKVWILIIVGFISLVVYILASSQQITQVKDTNTWSAIPDVVHKLNTTALSNVWQSVNGLFASIPSVVYLILMASMALWTLDLFLTRLRHSHSEIQMS